MSIEQYQHFVHIIQGPFMASLQASYYIHMLNLDDMLKLGLPIYPSQSLRFKNALYRHYNPDKSWQYTHDCIRAT
jgi:hypothetical protein